MNKSTVLKRAFKSMWRQNQNNCICPMNPRLDGKLALVTGGNAGIGLETCKGLIKRGAEVVILARNVQKAKYAMHIIENELNSRVHFVSLDLADLNSVTSAVENLGTLFPDRKIDVFIANAGIWPKKYSNSIQGYEIAFATNVLGHHALIRNLQNRSKINTDSRIVMLTGDIYILADNCTPNFLYKSIKGRQEAYSRSKLGNLWWVHEWNKRNKGIEVYAVHPGIVDSNLTIKSGRVGNLIKKKFLLSIEDGSQMSLFCATQPYLKSGGYYHNTMGHMKLRKDDPASDDSKASAFWELLEELVKEYILPKE